MSEQRFTIQKASGMYLHLPIFDNGVEMADGDVCILLNEQQATIERLTKMRDRWRELSNSFSAYCNCYEKAIERAFEEKPSPSEEDINRIYAELEKELENE